MKLRIHLAALVALLAAIELDLPAASSAPLLAVDFGTAGVSPQPGFLELAGAVSQTSASASLGGFAINLAGQGFGAASSSNAALVDQNVRGLYRDYYYNNSETPGDGVTLSIGNVTPNQQYNLTLWSYDGDQLFHPTQNIWGPTGANTSGNSGAIDFFADPYPTTSADYSTTIQVSSTSSTLEILGTVVAGATGGGTRLNGFRLNNGVADVLSVDLGQAVQPPSPVQAGFSGMSGNFPLGPNSPPPSLSSVFGVYTVTVSGDPYQSSDYTRVGFEDNAANAATIDSGIRALYQDALINNLDLNDGSGLDLSIQGVTPNTQYKLKVWSYNADNTIFATPTSFGPRAGSSTTGTTGSVTQFATPFPTTLDDYSTTITVSSTTGTLDIHAASTDNFGGTRLNAFELSLAVEPIPGDFNGSQSVNGADFSIWRTNFGAASGGSTATGDANGDHDVDGGDFLIWQQNFGAGPAVGIVPEPPSAIILAMAVATAGVWQRRSIPLLGRL